VQLWQVAPAGIFRVLGIFPVAISLFSASLEKIFGICENFVCICGKMGYNREYENL
jgi:hypothetical protein